MDPTAGTGLDPATAAVVGVLGLNALTAIFTAIFGGNGSRGLNERMAVVETRVDHALDGIDDIKAAMGIERRRNEKAKTS